MAVSRSPNPQFRHGMTVAAAVGIICFGIVLLAAHFVGH